MILEEIVNVCYDYTEKIPLGALCLLTIVGRNVENEEGLVA